MYLIITSKTYSHFRFGNSRRGRGGNWRRDNGYTSLSPWCWHQDDVERWHTDINKNHVECLEPLH